MCSCISFSWKQSCAFCSESRYISTLLLRLLLHVAFTSPAAWPLLGAYTVIPQYLWGSGSRTLPWIPKSACVLVSYVKGIVQPAHHIRSSTFTDRRCQPYPLSILRFASVYTRHIPDTLFTQVSPVFSACHSRPSRVWVELTFLLSPTKMPPPVILSLGRTHPSVNHHDM